MDAPVKIGLEVGTSRYEPGMTETKVEMVDPWLPREEGTTEL